MTALDWIFVVVLVGSMLIGAWRGLVFEILSAIGWIVAFLAAQWFAADVAQWLPMGETSESLRYAAGFVVVFVGSVFACGFLAWGAKKLIEVIGLRPADRALGALFGLVRGVVLLLVFTVVAQLTPLQEATWWQASQSAPLLVQVLQGARGSLPVSLEKLLPV